MSFPPLTAEQVRVLGALIEKQRTVPDTYPMSMSALVSACNQTSNRDPVVRYDESTVADAVRGLRERALVRGVHRLDARVPRFQHLLDEKLELDMAELAVLGVLMLRGPQTVGELRTRTERLHAFESIEAVDIVLTTLTTRDVPLVARLPRRPGQKELRYAHVLAGEVDLEGDSHSASDAPARESSAATHADRIRTLEQTVEDMKKELEEMRTQFQQFRTQFE
jgi:uncharacterized protein YceH (UPF0502 family)